jgi:glycosyltransferase involved in cell wall biosynthesis
MPVKNVEKYIKESIESVLCQTHNNFELLIIDDSTDNTTEIIKSIKDNRIVHKKFIGTLPAKLNYGLQISNADYIARMDGDDIIHQERFEIQLNYLLKYNYDLVGSNLLYVDLDGKPLLSKKYPEYNKEINFYMPINLSVAHASVLIRKEKLKRIGGYSEKVNFAEDMEMFLRLSQSGATFYNVQENLYYYRLVSDIFNINSNRNSESYLLGREYLEALLENKSDINYTNNILRFALLEYYKGDMNVSRKYFKKYLALNPQKKAHILRYLIISIFPGNGMKILRKYKIPQKINYFIHKIFKIDLQYQIKL